MIRRFIVPIILFSHRHALAVALAGLLVTVGAFALAATHLKMDTDESKMLSERLDWRQREIAFDKAFPQQNDLLVVVVDGLTPDDAEEATRRLTARLQQDHEHFKSVHRPDGGPWFVAHGLLLLPIADVRQLLDKTLEAQPLLGALAADPSPRGLFSALGLVAQGVEMGATQLAGIDPALKAIDKSLKSILENDPHALSWQNLLAGRSPSSDELQHVILVQPDLDFSNLAPGSAATDAVRADISELGYDASDDVRVRITGPVALSDEEMKSVTQGALAATIASTVLVLVWLILAVRSFRLILAIFGTLVVGFALTAGFAAISVGTLNLISVAFAVLFIGIAVDFSIQFSVRYRDERTRAADLSTALAETGRRIGGPIAVAAAATASGFYSFLPTAFQGVSELGLIAGTGMLIAFACNMTVLPALLTLVRPKPERDHVGFRWLAPFDTGFRKARWPVSGLAVLAAAVGLVLLPHLQFDFDPLHLKDTATESVSTLNDLMSNPLTSPYSAELIEPDPAAAAAKAAELEKLPEVSHAVTINSFVPGDQQAKLAVVQQAASIMLPTLMPPQVAPAPTPDQVRASAAATALQLEAAMAKTGADPVAAAFVGDLKTLSQASDAIVAKVSPVLLGSLPQRLDDLKLMLTAEPVTLDTLPDDVKRDWMTADGRARVEVYPKGNVRENQTLRRFFDAMQKTAPEATGSAITIQQSSNTIVRAFEIAGGSAVVAIALILGIALRRVADVALVLLPLLLAGLLTVIFCVTAPLPLNFANIIALPLLLGIGVAFDIYFVMNWRAGETHPLQSPTARAIVFSALTTGTAFGSLALSEHPGTASMGVLLIVSLIATLVCTLVVLPALLALAQTRGRVVNEQA